MKKDEEGKGDSTMSAKDARCVSLEQSGQARLDVHHKQPMGKPMRLRRGWSVIRTARHVAVKSKIHT